MNTPVHSVDDADGDDTDNIQEQQGLAEELQEADGSPVLDNAATMYRLRSDRGNVRANSPALATTQRQTAQQQSQDFRTGGAAEVKSPLNMAELIKRDRINAALLSVLFLLTRRTTPTHRMLKARRLSLGRKKERPKSNGVHFIPRLVTRLNARHEQLGNKHKNHQHSRPKERATAPTLQPRKKPCFPSAVD